MSTLFFERKHNMCALLDENHEKAGGYRDCIKWLKSSHIHHAISHSPTIYELHVRDFWRTAVMNVSVQPSRICAKVSGFDLEFTEADLARILRLEEDVGDEVCMTAEEVYGAFRIAGYEGPMPGEKKMEFVKSYMIQEWRYIAHVFIMCLDHRKGGTHGLNLNWARAMMLFCRGQKANLAKLIYSYMLENIHASKREKWLMYPRFVQMILNDKLPNLPVVGDVLKIWEMHSRIFGDCKSTERKRGGENIEVVEKRVRKRKAYAKEKDYSFDREVDEIQAEVDANREKRTKRKSDAPTETSKKAKHDTEGTSAESVSGLKGEIDSLKAELGELRSKYEELETQDAEKSTVIYEMGRMMKDQQCLMVRIFKELNSLKEKEGTEPAMSEAELKSLTDAARYPLMDVVFGDQNKGKGKAAEEPFDEEMSIDLDVFEGAEVVGGSSVNFSLIDEPEVDVNADSEEDLDDEPEMNKVEEKGVSYQFEHIDLDKSEWFKKDVAVIPEVPIFQHLDEPNTKQMDRQIIAWKYNTLIDAYMIKRRGGDISYIKNRKHFATLPRWDLPRLADLPLLGKEDSGRACAFEDFHKWFYDNGTGEAVIRLRGEDRPEIRLFDPMEVFSFCDEDLKVVCENRIKHGAGDDTRTEANLFVKVSNKAQGIRAELRNVNERLTKTNDQRMEMDDLSKQLDQTIEKRFETPVEVVDLDVTGEEHTEDIQAETIVLDVPDTDVADAEFVESMLVFSEDEAGSGDITNPMAGKKEGHELTLRTFEAKKKTEHK
ncbi:hypothetical protein QVD17_12281 [Tagetes erecta]|uniref:Uncharacterized protein n=1 Tax=Tagetes erecta TaxID=13708 RepID=A0AAD8KUQ5_TARER|nr:hypothetical protein QVD17_12281 [Tagetes erecta]